MQTEISCRWIEGGENEDNYVAGDRFKEIYGEMPQVVISGFHMMKKTAYTKEEEKVIINTAQELYDKGTCTLS